MAITWRHSAQGVYGLMGWGLQEARNPIPYLLFPPTAPQHWLPVLSASSERAGALYFTLFHAWHKAWLLIGTKWMFVQ